MTDTRALTNMLNRLRWYARRLKSMSAGEIGWRLLSEVRDLVELVRIATGHVPRCEGTVANPSRWLAISMLETGCWLGVSSGIQREWRDRLVGDADRLVSRHLSYFDLRNMPIGDPVDWHIDRNSGVRAPLRPIYFVDYRNAALFGDCKLVWEPNRHHHLVVLARAYKATGDRAYAREVVAQILDWCKANPFGMGMNWRSPLELGIRVINWVWALDLIRDSGVISSTELVQLTEVAYQHCDQVIRKYSQGSSANNHLIGEAAGVFVAASFFGFAKEWADESRAILARELRAQVYADGCTREHAFGYQYFVLQFYVACWVIAERSDERFDDDYRSRVLKMMSFLLELGLDGEIPAIGDCDDGYVLDLGDNGDRIAVVAWMNRLMGGDERFDILADERCEAQTWLGSPPARPAGPALRRSVSFPDAGYYLLRSDGDVPASVLFDCGELGYTKIAAHGHADALSIVVTLDRHPILIDPGTFDYFTYPQWREYFRSTRAHNTVEVDGLDQSSMAGPFMWHQHAISQLSFWQPTADGGRVEGEHNGYRRLNDPVTHRRSVILEGARLRIRDVLECAGPHSVRLHFHVAPECEVSRLAQNGFEVTVGDLGVRVQLANELAVDLIRGREGCCAGWYSSGYHRKEPAVTLRASASIEGTSTFETVLAWQRTA